MTREIKFRGMSSNGMVYGDLHHDIKGETAYYETHPCRIVWIEGTAHYNAAILNGTEGQFTGHHDKNGKKIYEGDYVMWTFRNPWGVRRIGPCEVEMKTAITCETENGDEIDCTGWFAGDNILDEECDIVGNIHETPELLED